MDKTKGFFQCVGITAVIWLVGRFVPSLVQQIVPVGYFLLLVIALGFLFLGWLAANAISKGRHPNCVTTNLYIFIVIEAAGVLNYVTMLSNLSLSTGRYSTDINGIPYDAYPRIILSGLLFTALYIGLCLFLKKKTTRLNQQTAVDPSAITQVNYRDNSLIMEFADGTTRVHQDVPEEIYRQLISANNIRKFYQDHIEGRYYSWNGGLQS